MNYLESISSNALITSIISLIIGLVLGLVIDLTKTTYSDQKTATDEANRLKKRLNNQLVELLDIFKKNRVVIEQSSLQGRIINDFNDAYIQYLNLGGPRYQLDINREFNDKGIYKRLQSTIGEIEQTNYYGWSESSEKLRYLKQLNHAIYSAVNTPKSNYAENVLELVAAFQNADAHGKHIIQRLYVWLRGK